MVAANGTVLPGGRLVRPLGVQIETGPGPSGLAVSLKGTIATADTGYERFGVTVIEPPGKRNPWQLRHIWARTPDSAAPEYAPPDWKGVTGGIAFDSDKSLWITEGGSGRIRQIDVASGDHGKIVSLNGGDWSGSFTTDLAYDGMHHLIYVVDQANARVAVVDQKAGHVISSVSVGKMPYAIALAPDGLAAYVTEQSGVCAIDLHDPMKPVVTDRIATPSAEAVLATGDRLYVSNARDDSITVVSANDHKEIANISLSVPGLEKFRGVLPAGMAYDPVNKWLLVAESGINAVGIIDTATNQSIADIPVGWTPTRVAIAGDRVYVANARARGTGPSPRRAVLELGEPYVLHPGSVSSFVMPAKSDVLNLTGDTYAMNGFIPHMKDAPKLPAAIRHVVLIVAGNRTFDEVMGDVGKVGSDPVQAVAKLAVFGMHASVNGGRTRFSVHDAAVTPNQHEIARRWAFSDNFYAAGETKAEGEYWLNGGYPDPVTESAIRASRSIPTSTALWDHLQRNGITFWDLPDDGVEGTIGKLAERDEFPQFLRITLHDDRDSEPDAERGFPYRASYVAEHDFEVGKILDFLSHSQWWRNMVVFITENDTQGGLDHVDAHRTLLFAAGPYVKRSYVSHTNSSVPGLLRTIFELLNVPAENLMDRTAASLRDMFTEQADYGAFTAIAPDARIYPGK